MLQNQENKLETKLCSSESRPGSKIEFSTLSKSMSPFYVFVTPRPKTRYCRVLRGGCSRGGGNWGTLTILREDWGTLRKH